ncbi:MAG: hypothetical protein HYS24_02950 [Ignavibacteriales bacterium]|nr:hypothetical protein [Ignavibacteriales bacterium]MBK7979958.1 hypothetical protein [Ignavibacteriota bacterium]
MKSSNLFWGFFFITFGALYLLGRYTAIDIDWYAAWDLWPIVLILIGISIILKGTIFRPIFSVIMGIVLALFIFGMINDTFDFFNRDNFHRKHFHDYSENSYIIEYQNDISEVNLNIAAGAGKFNIERTTEDLIKGNSEGNVGKYNFTKNQIDSIINVDIKMDDTGDKIFEGHLTNDFQLSLNENPVYNIDLQIGAAKSYFNLIPFKVKNISLKTGATETKIKLGNKIQETNLNVEMGAASLKIYIPQTSGCKITGDMALVSKDLDGFIVNGSDYVTDNFDTATEKILIHVNGGLSSFTVNKY